MPITSLIIGTAPGESANVAQQLADVPYVTITDVKEDSIIVITDTPQSEDDKTCWDAFTGIPGVVSSDVIYHNFEDVEQ